MNSILPNTRQAASGAGRLQSPALPRRTDATACDDQGTGRGRSGKPLHALDIAQRERLVAELNKREHLRDGRVCFKRVAAALRIGVNVIHRKLAAYRITQEDVFVGKLKRRFPRGTFAAAFLAFALAGIAATNPPALTLPKQQAAAPAQTNAATYTITLLWDKSASTNIAGYRVYWGIASGNYTNFNAVGKTNQTRLFGLVANRRYFAAVTTVDATGNEGTFSNEVGFELPLIQVPTLVVEHAPITTGPFLTVWELSATNEPMGFFRQYITNRYQSK